MSSAGRIFVQEAKNFVQVARRFFGLFTKGPLSFPVWAVTIIVATPLYVRTGVGELARNNSDGVLFLAADSLTLGSEGICGLGPNFAQESKKNAAVLRAYAKLTSERYFARILKLLHPDYDSAKRLLSLSRALDEPVKEEEARDVMWQVGNQIDRFHRDLEKLSAKEVTWSKSERLPKELVEDLDKTLAKSLQSVSTFERDLDGTPSGRVLSQLEQDKLVEDALVACQANRTTILVVFLSRMGYGNRERIEQALSLSKKSLGCKERLLVRIEDPEVKKTILAWRDSEQRRVRILDAMLSSDMATVRRLLEEAIERAFADRQEVRDG